MNPVFEEPDVICEIDEQKFGVAVKRLKTLSQMEKRLRKAAKQIQKSGSLGVISMEITLAVNSENVPIVTNQDENGVRDWWTREMGKRVDGISNRVWQKLRDTRVLGVFLHEHCPMCIGGNYVLRSMNYGIETSDGTAKILWQEFKNRCRSGFPNLIW